MDHFSKEIQDEITQLQNFVAHLESKLDSMQQLLMSFAVSTQFRKDQPYEAFLARYMITGDEKKLAVSVIDTVLCRAEGRTLPPIPSELRKNSIMEEAYVDKPIVASEAIHVIGRVFDSEDLGRKILAAYKATGTSPRAFEILNL
ncbi:hypothetical protein KIMH_07180 [Bombiscardovia apis]|uniref:Uncharacterized protein n=1 Tax=Bombiscardovia apis TaxID=2932182 RepID=A0ABN6SH66_9BIFI|nr:hypothetical protein [Bombiscardovia apis]BDR54607.1 hypothetical protein KIMH_07180 [Bombiscardovia apis]